MSHSTVILAEHSWQAVLPPPRVSGEAICHKVAQGALEESLWIVLIYFYASRINSHELSEQKNDLKASSNNSIVSYTQLVFN